MAASLASGSGTIGTESAQPDGDTQIAGLVFALLLVDTNGQVTQANYSAESLLGISANRLIGKSLLEILGPVDPRVEARLSEADEALVARDISVRGGDMRINLTMSPLGSHPGWRVVTLASAVHDDAARGDEAIAAVSAPAVLAHEIKNPLAAIRGAGQLAARKLPPADKKLAVMITDEVDRIARLIDRMQELGAQTTQEAAPCNPHEAIRSAIATVRAGSAEGVDIREAFDPSLPPAFANRDALEQVLINLVSNARDAALAEHNEGSEVIVQTRFASGLSFSAVRFGRAVKLPIEITISDNGAGIDPAISDHIFEPFISSKQSGQGLGLALVRKLVRDMNGSISHERDTRSGFTHFRVHLPLAPQASST
ncbi:ATP-binding protein [uncultured Erythrobacter sp.]|uniref:two-component system sensor histidine kinase NtrB n=1 Tax=uncultured Erythrobacter sp. TaxID=263913 RepID=UPI002619E401|nr:ATP-binding protein [uncultured Erythrobacter sp.]